MATYQARLGASKFMASTPKADCDESFTLFASRSSSTQVSPAARASIAPARENGTEHKPLPLTHPRCACIGTSSSRSIKWSLTECTSTTKGGSSASSVTGAGWAARLRGRAPRCMLPACQASFSSQTCWTPPTATAARLLMMMSESGAREAAESDVALGKRKVVTTTSAKDPPAARCLAADVRARFTAAESLWPMPRPLTTIGGEPSAVLAVRKDETKPRRSSREPRKAALGHSMTNRGSNSRQAHIVQEDPESNTRRAYRCELSSLEISLRLKKGIRSPSAKSPPSTASNVGDRHIR
mmetsp:Transcript_79480/g.199812  ORF Transcript_79480/g.199812 Transcript_79480/m.199812 type:complete len:298 (+) Transcript_79480:299-1192(+)